MGKKKCLIHYPQVARKDENGFVEVNASRHEKLLKARDARRNLGGCHEQSHIDQCNAVADNFAPGNHYHRECYNNFYRAVSEWDKEKENRVETPSSSTSSSISRPQRTKETDTAGRFPTYCFFCKKLELRKKDGGREHPTPMTLQSAVDTLLKAVALRCDKEMSDAIHGVNLMEKDFMKHNTCYKHYVSIVTNEKRRSGESVVKLDEWILVRKAISETVIGDQNCMTLDSLMDHKGIKVKNHIPRIPIVNQNMYLRNMQRGLWHMF